MITPDDRTLSQIEDSPADQFDDIDEMEPMNSTVTEARNLLAIQKALRRNPPPSADSGRLPSSFPKTYHFHRLFISEESEMYMDEGARQACEKYARAIALRQSYMDLSCPSFLKSKMPTISAGTFSYRWVDGVAKVWLANDSDPDLQLPLHPSPPSLSQYYRDLNQIMAICSDGPCKTHAYTRLMILEKKFHLHKIMNEKKEAAEQRECTSRDFYNVTKVDTHVHLSSAMNQKHLLKFIRRKLKTEADTVVICRDGKFLTLREVFESLNLSAKKISVDVLDVHADAGTFHRFDRFNLKYNPIGEARLREIFLKTDNLIKGRYLAEITRELIDDMEASRFQCAEWRVSVYGKSRSEWSNLASWAIDNNLISPNIVYLIQVPRLFHIYRANNLVESFQDMLEAIFDPLFQATIDPDSDPKLDQMLKHVVGIDCVDDESHPEHRAIMRYPVPRMWTGAKNPPYSYYLFYLRSSLATLNALRIARNKNTFEFRPHAGECGDLEHLQAAFLLSHGIAHGINLRRSSVLQYLFYLTQIPIDVSPLSNNSLFLPYNKNPFPQLFARGLNVTLSTDDPLQFHYTREPIIEEYAIAAQVWRFNSIDLCEIARNSVLHSGLPHETKIAVIGPHYGIPGELGNAMEYTNVPSIRLTYRHETLLIELVFIHRALEDDKTEDLSYFLNKIRQGSGTWLQHQSAVKKLFLEPKGMKHSELRRLSDRFR